ncbi:chemotaxis protein CheW [Leptolyngbya sp. FACHB-541]|uniref:chemotaxis protein CheW n=1 Tax=Leptolyngbya sp. FACHB-541 TaxID=2692810 RepID=UPI0016861182|nr:chemotaxis protein CheW [Leptolyngbya sp. FACHB-541]MBD1995521.1 chemotaxis protein CheW [Leptolyngbya sp. FACHB-541]
MALPSSFAYRRASRKVEPSQQLIAFRIHHEWFALPILVAQKVILLDKLHDSLFNTGASVAFYQEEELVVLDIGRRIFGEAIAKAANPDEPLAPNHTTTQIQFVNQQRYLVIVDSFHGEPIGLLLNSQPSLRRVPQSAFSPLPPNHFAEGGIRCVHALVTSIQGHPPLFLLNLHQLLEPVTHHFSGY